MTQSNDITHNMTQSNQITTHAPGSKYKYFASHTPTTAVEKINFFNLVNGNSSDVIEMKNEVGRIIKVVAVVFKPYHKVDENTGEIMEEGVLTYLKDKDGTYYTTSSKMFWHQINTMFITFGTPNEPHYKTLHVKIMSEKKQRGTQILADLVGIDE